MESTDNPFVRVGLVGGAAVLVGILFAVILVVPMLWMMGWWLFAGSAGGPGDHVMSRIDSEGIASHW